MSVVAGDLGVMMPTGRAMSDDGELHESVQDAVDASSSFVWVGPGTFSESVTISSEGLLLFGSGRGTLIDGGGGRAVDINADNVVVANLSVQTNASGGGNGVHISTQTGFIIQAVWIRQSGSIGIRPANSGSADGIIRGCIVEQSSGPSLSTQGNRIIITGCIFKGSAGSSDSVQLAGAGDILADCVITGAAADGIRGGSAIDAGAIIANRVINSAGDGIELPGTASDIIVAKNRISGSGGSDINDSGTNTVLSANRTGASN